MLEFLSLVKVITRRGQIPPLRVRNDNLTCFGVLPVCRCASLLELNALNGALLGFWGHVRVVLDGANLTFHGRRIRSRDRQHPCVASLGFDSLDSPLFGLWGHVRVVLDRLKLSFHRLLALLVGGRLRGGATSNQ